MPATGTQDHAPRQIAALLASYPHGARFLFRRDPSIHLPLADAFLISPSGLPILTPEIALLHKSNDLSRPENQADFLNALPALPPGRRAWLAAALQRLAPTHLWLAPLSQP